MRIDKQQRGDVAVLKPHGPLSGADADQMRTLLGKAMQESSGCVVVDASMVTFVDSRNLEVIVETAEQLIRSGKTLKLAGAGEIVREVLELTELAPMLEQFDGLDEALKSFA